MTDLWPDAEVGEMISDGVVLSFEAAGAITKVTAGGAITRGAQVHALVHLVKRSSARLRLARRTLLRQPKRTRTPTRLSCNMHPSRSVTKT